MKKRIVSVLRRLDIPKEGYANKQEETILSPTTSEIECNIASAEPQYIEDLRKEVALQKTSSASKLRSMFSMFPGRTSQDLEKPARFYADINQELALGTSARNIFGLHIQPTAVMPFFHEYNSDVLTEEDMDFVRTLTSESGDKTGALELYDRLQNYDGWLSCTLDVLRNPAVTMNALADLIVIHKEMEEATARIVNNPANHRRIMDALKAKFRLFLKPLSVLHLFHKYDPSVLVQEDLDIITDVTKEKGDQFGCDELLQRLMIYPGWHPCLMNVLRDPEVGLGDLCNHLNSALSDAFYEIKEAEQTAKRKFLNQLKYQREEEALKKKSVMLSESEEILAAIKEAKRKHTNAWKRLLKKGKSCPKYPGLDWRAGLAPHRLSHLPTEVELVEQTFEILESRYSIGQFLQGKKVDQFTCEPGLHERMLDPWFEAEKYADKYAINELLTFMLTRLILDEPGRPIDYLIDLSREINRLHMIRQEVAQQVEDNKKAHTEAGNNELQCTCANMKEKAAPLAHRESAIM